MEMTVVLILVLVALLVGGLTAFPAGYLMGAKQSDRDWKALVEGLVERVTTMQKHGFVGAPSSDGDVWAMDNDYELEVEQKRAEQQEADHARRLQALDIDLS